MSCNCGSCGGWGNADNLSGYVSAQGLQKVSTSPFTGATSRFDGSTGLVPPPAAGEEGYYLKGNGEWSPIASFDTFAGASAGADGSDGAVPQPLSGQQDLVLHGDGTWRSPENYRGATAGVPGIPGSVPPASAGQQDLFLRGDGTWGAAGGSTSSGLAGVKVKFDPSDWAQIGTDFVLTLSAGIHGLSDPSLLNIIETATGDYVLLQVNKSGSDITLTTPQAFAGEVTLLDTSPLPTVTI